MPSKEELRDGPLTLTIVPKNQLKKSLMSPLDYCSLSGLCESEIIDIDSLGKHANIVVESTTPKEIDEIFEVVDLGDIDKTSGEVVNIKILNGEEIKNQKSKFYEGDIIFGKLRPYLNNVAIIDEKPLKNDFFIGSSEWIRIEPKENPFYLFLALRSKSTLFQTAASKGSVRPRFTKEKLPNVEIPYIKDKKIVLAINNLVKEIFDIRTFADYVIKKLIETYDSLQDLEITDQLTIKKISKDNLSEKRMDLNYYLLEDLKDEIKTKNYKKLDDLIVFSTKRVQEMYVSEDTFEYITTSDVNPYQGEITHWEEKVYKPISPVSNKAPGRAVMLLNKNQILIPYLKLSIGAVGWVPKDLENFVASNGFAVLDAKNEDYGFLYLVLRSKLIITQLKLIAAGTIMEDINDSDIREILVLMPDEKTKEYLSKVTSEILEVKWETRKAYITIISLFEDLCYNNINIKAFKQGLDELSKSMSNLNVIINNLKKEYDL